MGRKGYWQVASLTCVCRRESCWQGLTHYTWTFSTEHSSLSSWLVISRSSSLNNGGGGGCGGAGAGAGAGGSGGEVDVPINDSLTESQVTTCDLPPPVCSHSPRVVQVGAPSILILDKWLFRIRSVNMLSSIQSTCWRQMSLYSTQGIFF